jgi:outer membrane protein assembly factor BamB
LADNEGFPQTIALTGALPGSTIAELNSFKTTYKLSAGDVTKDQRGFARNTAGAVNTGAYEYSNATLSTDATLQQLEISEGTLTPEFDANTFSYTVNVSYDVETINVTGTATDSKAGLTGNVTGKSLNVGENTVTVIVTAEDNLHTNNYTVTVIRQPDVTGNYASWSFVQLKSGELSGYVKVSNPVFSPDGNTVYVPTSSPKGHIFAIERETGTVKWVSEIATATYGGGVVVDADGTIYQCGTDKKVYAINPSDGSQKWTCDVDEVTGAFPALSRNGVLYCVTNKVTLYAINTATGAIAWNKTLTGTIGSAVAVDASGAIYVGTNKEIAKYGVSGEEVWKVSSELNVTERGAFAIDGTTLYAALKASAGLIAVNMADGVIKWTYANTDGGDAYFPVTGTDGTVYFNDKNGKKVYAVNPSDGTLKWEKNLGAAATYCGLALADNGKIYCGTQAKTGDVYKIYGLNTSNGDIDFQYNSNQQIMAGITIGPDKRLYIGTIGTVSTDGGRLFAIPVDANMAPSWSVRGSNLSGTNRQEPVDFIINGTRPASEYTLNYGNIVFESDGQLTNIDNSGLTVNGVVKYRKTFTPKQWYAVGFPFAPASYWGDFPENSDLYIWDSTFGDFWVKDYNGEAFNYCSAMEAGTGYIVQFPDDFENTEVVVTSEAGVTLKNITESDLDVALSLAESNRYYLVANPSVGNLTLSTPDKYYIYNGTSRFELLTSGMATVKPFESFVVANGVAENVLKTGLNVEETPTALEAIRLTDPVVRKEYYNLQGLKVQRPAKNALYIVTKIHSSGKTDTVKTIYK